MTISIERLTSFNSEVLLAVTQFNNEYLVEHPTDWDCCGFANPKIVFGRKRKIKNELIEAGIVKDSDSYSHWAGKYHVVRLSRDIAPHVGHQSMTYAEKRARVIMNVMKLHFPEIAEMLDIDSYMD